MYIAIAIRIRPNTIRKFGQNFCNLLKFILLPLTFYKYCNIISLLSKINPKVVRIAVRNKEILMKEFIYNEMMVHVGVCTNKNPENVLIISENAAGFVHEMQKYEDISCDVISANINLLRDAKDAAYDVVISEMDADAAVLAHYNRVLKEDGLLVTSIPSLDETQANKQIMEVLGKYTKVIMPFHVGGDKLSLLASKEYHPTADVILQRTDMLDGLAYYNCDVHVGSFAMGNHIRKEYLGIIKN